MLTKKEAEDFFSRWAAYRSEVSNASFATKICKHPVYIRLVEIILEKSAEFEKVRLASLAKPTDLSPKEFQWKEFFRKHSFDSTNQMRIMAEMISILDNVDVLRFITISNGERVQFPAFVCIVPIANNGGHNYDIDRPAVSFFVGNTFFRISGTHGNTMDSDPTGYRIATQVELETLLMSIMYKNYSVADYIMEFLHESGEIQPDEDNEDFDNEDENNEEDQD